MWSCPSRCRIPCTSSEPELGRRVVGVVPRGDRRRDHDVADLAEPVLARLLVQREREHVGRAGLVQVALVELGDLGLGDQRDRELGVRDPLAEQGRPREADEALEIDRRVLPVVERDERRLVPVSHRREHAALRRRGTPPRCPGRSCAEPRLGRRGGHLDPLDVPEDLLDDHQARGLAGRQVDLRDVAVDDGLRAEPQPREEHLHLLGRRVLRLVQDDERVVQRAAPHEREWRDLDGPALHEARERVGAHHLEQRVVQRLHVRDRSSRRAFPAGTRAARPPRRPAGSRIRRETCFSWSARTAVATAR